MAKAKTQRDWFNAPQATTEKRLVRLFEQVNVVNLSDIPDLLKAADVAPKLGLSPKTVNLMMARQEIKSEKIGRHWFTTAKCVADYMIKEMNKKAHG